ncbi:ZIP family metal transporter [Eubacteriales bacterium OttesenSCG-928-N13]|nr:ZIP family metal transporter [Eubacteriales bacterium OttesenSCG-928-N13]
MQQNIVFMAFLATMGTWLVTAMGAATVVFIKRIHHRFMNAMLGFAAGVMIAASFWSLLQPAIERAEQSLSMPAWLVATLGFVSGALFIWASDKAVTWAQRRAEEEISPVGSDQGAALPKNERLRRVMMLVFSITLHNIPEGLAVGVAFGALQQNHSTEALMAAISVAIGIGLQNFPEGAAVSIPLRREGYSRSKCFLLGQASGMVEPVAGVLGALLVVRMQTILPFALAFAAGAMVLVAVHELIPECQRNRGVSPYVATMGIIAGFSVMMLMDVLLG